MRIEKTLSPEQLAEVAVRQRGQQASWRDAPRDGYDVVVNGQPIRVLPDVFPPRGDTALLIQNLTIPDGAAVLDVGTGTGVLAVMACQMGASRCIALDINPAAVRNAEANRTHLGLAERLDIRLSDGLAELRNDERFDLVIANLPGRAAPASDHVEAAQWDEGFATHRHFFAGIGAHLEPGGRIVMTKANYPEINDVLAIAERQGLLARVLAKQLPKDDDPRTYYVLEFVLPDEEGR